MMHGNKEGGEERKKRGEGDREEGTETGGRGINKGRECKGRKKREISEEERKEGEEREEKEGKVLGRNDKEKEKKI